MISGFSVCSQIVESLKAHVPYIHYTMQMGSFHQKVLLFVKKIIALPSASPGFAELRKNCSQTINMLNFSPQLCYHVSEPFSVHALE
jgi:hypothetical protein